MVTTRDDSRRAYVRGKLESVFAPRSIAVVGASERVEAPGGRVIRYLQAHGYPGAIYPITRRPGPVQGLEAFSGLEGLPEVPQIVIVAIGVEAVPEILERAGGLGVDGAVVFGAGADADLAERIRSISEMSGVLLLGPNCTGFMNVPGRVAASFNSALELTDVRPGALSVVTQSGGVGSVLFNRLHDAGVGLRFMVSTGDELDVGIGDVLAYLAADQGTETVIAYVESFRSADSFLDGADALRVAGKRLLVLKAGNSPVAQSAAQTHTNALATDGEVAAAVLHEVGAVPVPTIRQAVDAAAVDEALRAAGAGARATSAIAFIGTSGGGCVLAADAAARAALPVVQFTAATAAALDALLPSFATVANPLDVTAGLLNDPDRLREVIETVARDENVELIVIVGLISTRVLVETVGRAVADVRAAGGPPIVAAVESGSLVQDVYAALRIPGAATVFGLDDCMQALALASPSVDVAPVAPAGEVGIDEPAPDLGPGARDLSEDESLRVLAAAGLPAVVTSPVETPEDLDRLDYPIALKVSGASVFHKHRYGLLALDLATPAAAKAAHENLSRAAREAGLQEWQVVAQPMAPRGIELLLGLRVDPVFGSLVVLGVGGTLVEDIGHVALARALAAQHDPGSLIGRAGIEASLSPPSRAALAEAIRRFSAFVLASAPRLRECEVNPVIVKPDGTLAIVDAKVCVDA